MGGSDAVTGDMAPSSSGGSLIAFSFEDAGMYGNHSVVTVGGQDGGVWHYETDLDGDGVLDGTTIVQECPMQTKRTSNQTVC